MIIKELQEQGTPFESRGEGVEIPSDPAKSNRTPNLVYARAKLGEARMRPIDENSDLQTAIAKIHSICSTVSCSSGR